MRYVGGKTRLSSWVAGHLVEYGEGCIRYIEPFLGSAAVMSRMAPKVRESIGSDLHPDLILMWTALQSGWLPPDKITREEYEVLRNAEPSALRGLVGFGASYGGRWFASFVERSWNKYHEKWERDFFEVARESSLRNAAVMARNSTRIIHCPYWEHSPKTGDLVYCDPPYQATQGYSTGDFDHERFWETVRIWSRNGAKVLVSESRCPSDFSVLAEKSRKELLSSIKTSDRREGLFIYP